MDQEQTPSTEDSQYSAAADPPRRSPRWLLPLAIAIVIFAVYAPALGFEFVYDDRTQIVENRQLDSWRMISQYFAEHSWAHSFPGIRGTYYRPLFLLWLFFNRMLFGLSTPWWHLTGILIHVAAALLVYALAHKLTGDRWIGAVAALLFGLHPVHVESVAWVSGATDSLAALLVLGSLLCFMRAERKWDLLSWGLYALALLDKETAVILPCVVFAYVWLFRDTGAAGVRRRFAAALPAMLPYIGVTLVYIWARMAALHGLAVDQTPVPLRYMLLTWPSILLFYLMHLVWPVGLSAFYTLPLVTAVDLRHVVLPCIILAIVAGVLVVIASRSRVAALSTLFLILPLLPVLNLRALPLAESVHDRYLYLPSIGACILIALGMRRLGGLQLRTALAGVILCALGFGLVREAAYWSDDLTMASRAIAIAPGSEAANINYADVLYLRNDSAGSIPYLKRALELNPHGSSAVYGLGRSYYALGMYSEAAREYEKVTATNTPFGAIYRDHGLAEMELGHLQRAEELFRRAIRLKGLDDYRGFHLALAVLLERKGDTQGAMRELEAELRENPDSSEALSGVNELKARGVR